MIIVKIHAGLGNQMFQYATGRRLAHFRKTELKLDISSFENMAEVDTPRTYELEDYKITSKAADDADLSRVLPIEFKATLPYRIRRRLGHDKRLRPLGEHSKAFSDTVLRVRDNTYLVGWWQNEKYFGDIRHILLEEFQPRSLSQYSVELLNQIKRADSVSIHVRRGDYVTNKYANKEHGLASLDYYKSAAERVTKKIKSPHFFVFSDDLYWCKKNLILSDNMVFVETRNRRPCEDVFLMQHCQHNIIANSSFSWWGAWLNENPDKIVVAPKSWFQNKQSDKETEIVPKSWIRL